MATTLTITISAGTPPAVKVSGTTPTPALTSLEQKETIEALRFHLHNLSRRKDTKRTNATAKALKKLCAEAKT